uniref:Uncharacterized protein n=1 Tax=Oryza brachyantha TaxID=4533 RepID=J3L0V3_ORYBR
LRFFTLDFAGRPFLLLLYHHHHRTAQSYPFFFSLLSFFRLFFFPPWIAHPTHLTPKQSGLLLLDRSAINCTPRPDPNSLFPLLPPPHQGLILVARSLAALQAKLIKLSLLMLTNQP